MVDLESVDDRFVAIKFVPMKTILFFSIFLDDPVCLGVRSIKHADVLSEKLISKPREVQNSPNLTQGTVTQYILRLVIFQPHPTPPYMSKNAQMC